MDIKLIDRGTEGELILSGRIDAKNAEEFGQILSKMADRFRDLTLDMSGLKYISSAGLRSIQLLYMKVHNNGGELSAKNVNKYIKEVFELTGFAEILNIS